MNPIVTSQQTARRFVLGKQGLWPGRRWMGKKGTAQAIRACEAVQVDPMNIIARSQDFVLHSCVLESLAKGKVPKGWNPRETTTLEEVTNLSTLDIVSARGRAKKLFDLEYKWEVYTPAHQRSWGYYVLPILYGDDLVARVDPKLDRTKMGMEIRGFWHEDDAPVKEPAFVDALAKGLIRFAKFVEAKRIQIDSIHPTGLWRQVQVAMSELIEVGRQWLAHPPLELQMSLRVAKSGAAGR